jgi:hypothetical protein
MVSGMGLNGTGLFYSSFLAPDADVTLTTLSDLVMKTDSTVVASVTDNVKNTIPNQLVNRL